MFNANLTNCDQEPIHIPGKIQSHGFLIVADQSHKIAFCSENISEFLPLSAASVLSHPLALLEDHLNYATPGDFLTQLILLGSVNNDFEPFNPYSIKIRGEAFNLIISVSGDYYLLDFEPEYSDLNSNLLPIIGHGLSQMMADANLTSLLGNAAVQIKKIIGYDRVMVYKFYDDGHGEVISEAKETHLNPWIGLHFPSSDIPRQARDLYKINLTRLISDVYSEPSSIATLKHLANFPLDLTHSTLRAVSPIHIQYLKNMGVASSFSISLICNGELWGLVACHNYTPRFINYKERESAKLIGQVLSSALCFRQHEHNLVKSNRLKEAVVTLGKELIRNESIERTLFDHPVTLLDAVDATGVFMSFDNRIYCAGITPDESFLTDLVNWLGDNMSSSFYQCNNFSAEYPEAIRFTDCASGILACRLSKELKEYMVWFRPEMVKTVNWAGNPDKPMELSTDGLMYIAPRKSFETWSQTVRYTAAPWHTEDTQSALLIREEVGFAISRKTMEIRILNEKLKEAYNELNSFSYTISHDLKNPLTTIKNFSQLLTREPSLTERGQHLLDRILVSANKMQTMIAEILRYSQVGQHNIVPILVNMENLLQELKAELLGASGNDRLEIEINNPLEVYGDQTMVMQVFSNLMGNAVKYSSQTAAPKVRVSTKDTGESIQYSVSDNGVGIRAEDQEKIFDLFIRSDDVKGYEGTGVGLSIVKKIMEKHDGRVWVESDRKTGTTFHVAFKKLQPIAETLLQNA
ncbi:MAG: ATP-binding protein [Sphingobacteriaceae bacterium]